MKYRMLPMLIVLVLALTVGCGTAAKPVQPVVPGAINATDAYTYRVVSDAQAAIHSVKTWQQCSEKQFPETLDVDGTQEKCDPSAGTFPPQAKPALNYAISSYNIAQAAGKTYHAGGSNDVKGLTAALNQLSQAITSMLTQTGTVKTGVKP